MRTRVVAVALVFLSSAPVFAQTPPVLSSRPSAAYTLYLNFGGFDYTGTWFGDTPGSTPAYDTDNNTATFSTTELADIRNIWSRSAEKYSAFNINVTTVDPAIAAGQAGSHSARQNYYDSQAGLMHMVIGGDGGWAGGGGIVGISGLDVAESPITGGLHTNWTFSTNYVSGGIPFHRGIAETIAHENGHALKLEHQSRYTPFFEEYHSGDANRAPIMGNSDNAARGLWKRGTSTSSTTIQNDVALLLTNAGIAGSGVAGFVDSGVGHTRPTATAIPLTGNTIDHTLAKGVITPNTSSPNPSGTANYTTDFFTFTFGPDGGNIDVFLRSGLSTLTPGTADPGAMLDATLRLLDGSGALVTSSGTTNNLSERITRALGAGTYYLQISSAGADPEYFDMGSYFLTGTIVPVPEPGAVLLVAAAGFGLWRSRRAGRGGFATSPAVPRGGG